MKFFFQLSCMHAIHGRTPKEGSGGRNEVLPKSPRTPRIIVRPHHKLGSVEKNDATHDDLRTPTLYCLIAASLSESL